MKRRRPTKNKIGFLIKPKSLKTSVDMSGIIVFIKFRKAMLERSGIVLTSDLFSLAANLFGRMEKQLVKSEKLS